MKEGRVVIIGGGLAGMVIAKEAAKRDLPVVLLEASCRLGGKAGAEQDKNGIYQEHGYHVFPGWYLNTRRLLHELNIEDNLVDIEKFHHLKKGPFKRGTAPHLITFYPMSSLGNVFRNLTSGLLPWTQTLMSFYFALDLAAEPLSNRGFLDLISANGFLRSRFYATEEMATLHQQTVLQASAIPNYELSAKTSQKLVHLWSETPTPIYSILNGNLHEKFIAPFEQRLRKLGVEIQFGRRVRKLDVSDDGHICGVQFDEGEPLKGEGDIFVLATPHGVITERLLDQQLFATEAKKEYPAEREKHLDVDEKRKLLCDLAHLQSEPMAALHLHFNCRIPHLPKEHVNLYGSRLGLSFIDVSQQWRGLNNTVLSVIASHFIPLAHLSPSEAEKVIIDELREYVPFEPEEIDGVKSQMRPNVEVPLFLNTIGAWHFRPATRTRIDNLYIAGDYCRSDADLTTMESAVISAMRTSRAVLKARGKRHRGPVPLKVPRKRWLRLWRYVGRYVALGAVWPIGLWFWLRRQLADLPAGAPWNAIRSLLASAPAG